MLKSDLAQTDKKNFDFVLTEEYILNIYNLFKNYMKDLNKLFYGETTGGKINDFKKGLTEIENKHKDYFAKRKPKNEYNKNDRLHNHYGMINDAHKITFGFNKGSDIEPTIITECLNLFNSIFNPNE